MFEPSDEGSSVNGFCTGHHPAKAISKFMMFKVVTKEKRGDGMALDAISAGIISSVLMYIAPNRRRCW